MMPQPPRIDAHHHLWHYSAEEYGWIDEPMAVIRRDFTPGDLLEEMRTAHVDGAIAVQARETLAETHWLLAEAQACDHIVGVVGWVGLEAPRLSETLEKFTDAALVGVREVLQGRPLGALDEQTLDPGLRLLRTRGLVYDLLIRAEQLPEATRLVDRHPNQTFVLDHAAKPHIAEGDLQPWQDQMHSLAARPNVTCKLSGLVTEAAWQGWTAETLRPYLDTCVAAFGPRRLLAGSDWPVCLVASSYSHWWQTLDDYFAPFTPEERALVFGQNAIATYRIKLPIEVTP